MGPVAAPGIRVMRQSRAIMLRPVEAIRRREEPCATSCRSARALTAGGVASGPFHARLTLPGASESSAEWTSEVTYDPAQQSGAASVARWAHDAGTSYHVADSWAAVDADTATTKSTRR